jgi:hypothetical protein
MGRIHPPRHDEARSRGECGHGPNGGCRAEQVRQHARHDGAGSVALLGFGIDSFIETASGGILIWRLRSETAGIDERAIERLEHQAERLVAVSFVLLAFYVAIDAFLALWNQHRPDVSTVGIALTSLSLLVMGWLARAKQRTARDHGRRALGRGCPSDMGLPVALGDRPRRRRLERAVRLVVGRPGCRARALCLLDQGGT